MARSQRLEARVQGELDEADGVEEELIEPDRLSSWKNDRNPMQIWTGGSAPNLNSKSVSASLEGLEAREPTLTIQESSFRSAPGIDGRERESRISGGVRLPCAHRNGRDPGPDPPPNGAAA